MKKFSQYLALATLLVSTSVFAQTNKSGSYTTSSAAVTDTVSALAQSGLTWVLQQNLQFTAKGLVDKEIVDEPLTPELIERIMTYWDGRMFQKFGIGEIGGNVLSVTYDATQAARLAGARNQEALNAEYAKAARANAPAVATTTTPPPPALAQNTPPLNDGVVEAVEPQYKTVDISSLSVTDLKGQLTSLMEAKVAVRSVTFRGLLSRMGSRAVLGSLQVLFIGGAAGNLAHAAYYAKTAFSAPVDTWTSDRCSQIKTQSTGQTDTVCPPPNILTNWLDSSNVVYYKFFADQPAAVKPADPNAPVTK